MLSPRDGDLFPAARRVRAVSRDELFDHLPYGVVTVLDVRPEDEFVNGHGG